MTSLDDTTIARLGHLNYVETSREYARWSGRQGAVVEEDGLMLFATGSPFPVLLNGVWRLDAGVPGDEVIGRADEWFAARGRGYTVMVRPGVEEDVDLLAAALGAGLHAVTDSPEMVIRARVAPPTLPDGVSLRWLAEDARLADFTRVSDAAYATLGMPDGVTTEAATDLARMTEPHVHAVIAYRDDRPLAAAVTVLSHGIAGVYWVGTVPDARGMGLGEAVARAVTNRAFDRAALACTLQASAMGEPIYTRMGYETLYRYNGLVRFEPAAV